MSLLTLYGSFKVPKGHCWVLGDNLPYSRDSRMFGALPMALISGKIIAKFNTEALSLFSPSSWFTFFSWIENGLQSAPEDDED
jgi:inner membrane protease subunit 1